MPSRDQMAASLGPPPAILSPVKGGLSPSDAIKSLPGGASSTPTQLHSQFQKLQNREVLLPSPERRRSLRPIHAPPAPSEAGSDLFNITRDFASKMTFASSDSSHSHQADSPGRISFVYSDEVMRALKKAKKSPRQVKPSKYDVRIYRLPSLVHSAAPRPPFTPGTATAVHDTKALLNHPEDKQTHNLPKLKKNPKLISEDGFGVYFRWFADQHSTIGADFDIPRRPPGPPKKRKPEEPQRPRTDASPVVTMSVASQTDPEPTEMMLLKPAKSRNKSKTSAHSAFSTPRW